MTTATIVAAGGGVELLVTASTTAPATLRLRSAGAPTSRTVSTQPLVEVLALGHGRAWSGTRYTETAIGSRLRHTRHALRRSGAWQELQVVQRDDVTGLDVTSHYQLHDGCSALRGWTTVANAGVEPITLQAVTSLLLADFDWCGRSSVDAMTLLRGRSDWLAEGRWSEQPLRAAGLPALTAPGRTLRTRGCVQASSASSWPTSEELPTGVLANPASGRSWAWQVEHNGPWLWQVGELDDGLYLALLGPTDEQHQWQLELAPGETFESVPATIAVGDGDAVAALTEFRRTALHSQAVFPVVFNDYMNTVMGDPSAQLLNPLIDAAADAGAEYFVIDAGWYADDGDWWDSVGEWQPSDHRFPDGIDAVLDRIRRRGMVPGLWLEPEVVGVSSTTAIKLPDDAFLSRGGTRVVEHGRYHLDLSSAAARTFLDEVIGRLVGDHGIGYFKFDYNIRAGSGSDATTPSVGHGLLLHNRAYLRWIEDLRERYPSLLLENCASGGMRQDYATLSRFHLQSTSDQEDLHAYPPIAAGAPMLVLPEQAGNWAYPQPGMTDDDIVFTLATAVLGRLYLSGWLHRLPPRQRAIVRAAVLAHKAVRDRMPHCVPFWPLGLPGWRDEWIALGLRESETLYVTVWRRAAQSGTTTLPLPAPPPGRRWAEPTSVFPDESPLEMRLDDNLHVTDPTGRQAARVVKLTSAPAT